MKITLGFVGVLWGFIGGQLRLELSRPTGRSVVVEASSDLQIWLPIWTNTFADPFNFSDPQGGIYSNRFYRAHLP